MAANFDHEKSLASFAKFLGKGLFGIKTGAYRFNREKGKHELTITGEAYFEPIAINRACDYIDLRDGKEQIWITLQTLKGIPEPNEMGRRYHSYKDIAHYTNVYLDVDAAKPKVFKDFAATEEERAKARDQMPVVETWLVSKGLGFGLRLLTGNGCGFVLPIPPTSTTPDFIAKVATFLKVVRVETGCNIDTTMFDPGRVIGIPGTVNCKLENDDRKNHRREVIGQIPERMEDTKLLEYIARLTPDAEALRYWSKQLGAEKKESKQKTNTFQGLNDSDNELIKRICAAANSEKFRRLMQGDTTGYTSESEADAGLCSIIAFYTKDFDQILRIVQCSALWDEKWEREDYQERTIGSAIDFVEEKGKGTGPKKSGEEDIQVNGRYLQDISADAMDALQKHNEPPQIFVRSGHLARLVTKDRVVIEPLNENALRGQLARSAGFVKFDGLDENDEPKFTKARPPLDVVRDILSLCEWPGLPSIEAIVETPVLRQDGTLLCRSGYDPATRLYYAPGPGLQKVRVLEIPSGEDARTAAKHILDELFADFPFKDDASRANSLGLMLSVVVRPMIDGNLPLALLDKPQAGTGASFLAEVVAMIATGRPACMMGAPETEDEWRKSITSALLDGSPVIVIDNVVGKLRSGSLTRALTSRTWRDRFLGKSEMLDLPQRAAWIATGNNISIGGDLARRSYWIRMDASMARPWLRTGFKHEDLLGWIRANHAEILSDLLTMARAWVVAGRPAGSAKTLGGFKEWSEVISGVLDFAGVSGFLTNAPELYDSMDQDVQQWDEFLGEWAAIHADHPISAGMLRDELISTDQIYRTLKDAMPDDVAEAVGKDRKRSLSLGHVLRKHLDQIYPSGRKLCQEKDSHNKTSLWKVCGICGNPEKEKSASEDASAGFAGFSPISRHFSEKESESIKCIEVEQNPANPAKVQDDIDCRKTQNPADLEGVTYLPENFIEADLQRAEEQRLEKEAHDRAQAAKYTGKRPKSYSEMAGSVPFDTSSPEAVKICRSIRGQLMKGIAPRIDFLVKETELPKESVEGYLNSAPWIRKDDSSPAGIVVYLPLEASA